MNRMQAHVSQLLGYVRNESQREQKMAVTRIPEALSQMDGIFGCKLVEQTDQNGNKATLFRKKNFFEWVCDVLFDLHVNPVTNPQALAALDEIAEKIKDFETGDFKKLLEGYKSSGAKIDFREVKKTLEASLAWEFPPRVFSRDASDSCDLTLVYLYEEVHRKNMRKGECLEKKTMPLISGNNYDKVSDANIRAYCNLLNDFYLIEGVPIAAETDEKTEIRLLLTAAELSLESNISESEDSEVEINELQARLDALNNVSFIEAMVDFEEVYTENLRKIIGEEVKGVQQEAARIEVLVGADGVSDENIRGLAKALVQIKHSEKREFEVVIPEAASEAGTDIRVRLNAAYIEARIEHLENLPAGG